MIFKIVQVTSMNNLCRSLDIPGVTWSSRGYNATKKIAPWLCYINQLCRVQSLAPLWLSSSLKRSLLPRRKKAS